MGFITKLPEEPTAEQYRAQANAYMDEAKALTVKQRELHDKAEIAMRKSIELRGKSSLPPKDA